jgi:hypothetical protein
MMVCLVVLYLMLMKAFKHFLFAERPFLYSCLYLSIHPSTYTIHNNVVVYVDHKFSSKYINLYRSYIHLADGFVWLWVGLMYVHTYVLYCRMDGWMNDGR